MQTFLPYESYADSAAALDRQRLGKQRVETLQIMNALVFGGGWSNHPAVRMWRGHEWALYDYQEATVAEWLRRGYRDTCLVKTRLLLPDDAEDTTPPWLGDPAFHRSHQSNLLRKDPEHYGQYFPDTPLNLPYVWPTL